ncbi:hypothetical protein JTT02_19475 [Clostridium botulinum]|nr:hypothetical protein [Clostridium botulinum]
MAEDLQVTRQTINAIEKTNITLVWS